MANEAFSAASPRQRPAAASSDWRVPCPVIEQANIILRLRNQVGARRGTSLAIAMSVAISATILLLIGSPIISRAATIEEVARCRAIQIKKQQWDCFKSLKAPKQNAPKAKRDDTRQSQKEDVPKVQRRRFRR